MIILTGILTVSCRNKIDSDKKYYQQPRYSKTWIKKNIENKIDEKKEVFVSKDLDTVENQIIFYRNNKVLFRSFYYVLKGLSPTTNENQNCKIKVHTWLDSIPKEQIVETIFSFSYAQEINDSIFLKSVKVKNSTEIDFPYKIFNDNLIEGILTGQIIVKGSNSSKLEVSEIKMLVSNKNDINGVLVETYFGKN